MLEFLWEYHGKKEEVQNKKLKILQVMNEEKSFLVKSPGSYEKFPKVK